MKSPLAPLISHSWGRTIVSPNWILVRSWSQAALLFFLSTCKESPEPSPLDADTCPYSQKLDCNKKLQIFTVCYPDADGLPAECSHFGGLRNDTLVAATSSGINTRYAFKSDRLVKIFNSNNDIAIIRYYDPLTDLPSIEFRYDVDPYHYTKMDFVRLSAKSFARMDSSVSLDWQRSVPGNLVFIKTFLKSTEVTYDGDNLTAVVFKDNAGKVTETYAYEYDDRPSPFYLYYMLLEFPYLYPDLIPLSKNNITGIKVLDGGGQLKSEISFTYTYQCDQIMSMRKMVSGDPPVCIELEYSVL